MALATLSIDLEANLARFEGDLGKASRALDKLASDAKSSFATVGAVFSGSLLAGAAEEAVRQMVNLFPSLIDGVAAFQDLSEETGASAEALASFQTAADVSGVTVKDLAGLMIKLTGNLSKLTDEGKGAGAALKALGIPIAEFKALSPDEQIKRLAAEFDKFAEGSGKTATALALFGKSGAQVLTFFNEYQTGAGASNRLTAEMIAQADAWGDAHARSRSELKQTAQVIAVQMLPALTALETGFKAGALEIIGFNKSAGGLDPRAILDFAETGAIAVGTLAEALVGIVKTARAVGGSFQSVGADLSALNAVALVANPLAQGSFQERVANMGAALENRNKVAAEANQRYLDLWKYNGTAITDNLRKTFAEQRRLLDPENQRELNRMREAAAGGGKPALNLAMPDSAKTERDSGFQRFMAQIKKQDELAQQQLDTGGKLSESDRKRIELLADLSDASKGYTATQKAEGSAAVSALVDKLKAFETEQAMAKSREFALSVQERSVAVWLKEGSSISEANARLAEQIEEMGLSADAVDKLRVKRLEDARATEEQALMGLYLVGASEAEISAAKRKLAVMQEQISLTRQQQGKGGNLAADPMKGASDAIDAYLAKVKESGTATRDAVGQTMASLENDLVNSLKSGKLDLSRTIDFMIGEFLRLAVVKPMLASLFDSSGSGGSGSWLSGLFKLFGTASANANGNAFGASGVMPFASGGIVDSPTLFKFANGGAMAAGVMGEAGAEGILPLKRGPGGKLGVSMYGGGGASPISITQNISVGAGVSRNEVMAAMEQTKRSTMAAIADAQRRGRQYA